MTSEAELPIAVWLSGGGTTLRNLLDEQERGRLPIRVVHVASSRPDVRGVQRAHDAGLPVDIIERGKFASVDAFSDALFAGARQGGARLVCLAGFLRLIKVPDDFIGRVMNVHPSLLPAFGGKGMHGHHVHEAVLAHGAKVSGCTVHFADNAYDQGPIILQRPVPVLDDDTPETLAARVFAEECVAYPEAIRLFAADRLRSDGRRVRIIS
jgi:formyltetrahydrofolate-dependent phosphoribosylglycinamide formyltransferase